jgi:hypothetical protein
MGCSGQICYLPYCNLSKKIKKEKNKKGQSSMVCESWGTQRIRLAMVCKKKSGEECQALQKSTNVPNSLNLVSMEDSKNPITSH